MGELFLGRVPGQPSHSAREHHGTETNGRVGGTFFGSKDKGRAQAQKAARLHRNTHPGSLTRPIFVKPKDVYPMENPADPSGPPIWRIHDDKPLNNLPPDGTQNAPHPDKTKHP